MNFALLIGEGIRHSPNLDTSKFKSLKENLLSVTIQHLSFSFRNPWPRPGSSGVEHPTEESRQGGQGRPKSKIKIF
jgi:hypothetical protein